MLTVYFFSAIYSLSYPKNSFTHSLVARPENRDRNIHSHEDSKAQSDTRLFWKNLKDCGHSWVKTKINIKIFLVLVHLRDLVTLWQDLIIPIAGFRIVNNLVDKRDCP